MAMGGEAAQYNGRITSFVLFSCMMAAMGGAIFGYDTGISGNFLISHHFLVYFTILMKYYTFLLFIKTEVELILLMYAGKVKKLKINGEII